MVEVITRLYAELDQSNMAHAFMVALLFCIYKENRSKFCLKNFNSEIEINDYKLILQQYLNSGKITELIHAF